MFNKILFVKMRIAVVFSVLNEDMKKVFGTIMNSLPLVITLKQCSQHGRSV